MAVAKGLMAHEPLLKPALRRGKLLDDFLNSQPNLLYSVNFNITRSPISFFLFCKLLLTLFDSRLHHSRSKKRGKKEGWPSQSPEEAYLGQEIEPVLYVQYTNYTSHRIVTNSGKSHCSNLLKLNRSILTRPGISRKLVFSNSAAYPAQVPDNTKPPCLTNQRPNSRHFPRVHPHHQVIKTPNLRNNPNPALGDL